MQGKWTLILVVIMLSATSVVGQDLSKLRVKPDTAIIDQEDEVKLDYKPIIVPIPRLERSVDYWKHWTKFGINTNQSYFSDNWKEGGTNSLSIGAIGWHKSEYNKNNFNFVTEVDLKYGKIKNRDQLAKKNNDRIFWDNKLSYNISKSWAVFTSLTFESQFDLGFTYKRDEDGAEVVNDTVSNFMAPGYLTESLGLEYKPDDSFSLRLGTGTSRQTLVLDDQIQAKEDGSRFGVEAGKKIKNDLAFQVTANLNKNLSDNLNLKSRYNLFADYSRLSDPVHRLDMTLTANISKIVNVSLDGIMLYDTDIDTKVQFSESLALGITFNFPR